MSSSLRASALVIFLCLSLFASRPARAVNIAISNPTASKILFPDAGPGDPNTVLPPAQGATFQVTGNPNQVFNVTLPGTVNMVLGPDTVSASTFTATPGSGNGCCTLDATGKATVMVGATRRAIQVSDNPGTYVGTASVTVVYQSGGASAIGTATTQLRVLAPMSAVVNSPLSLGAGMINDPAKIIAPGGFGSAQVTVTGEPSHAFNITFPTASITLTTGNGAGATKKIVVNAFTSSPATPGMFNGSGTCVVRIGATRAALLATQVQGTYSGSFTLRVLYY